MRPTWDQLFMKIALDVSERSTCVRVKVGCALIKNNRVISMGYNGSAEGFPHCDEHWKDQDFIQSKEFYTAHHEWAETHEIHAEQNAIAYSAKNGIATKDCTLYVTYSPCIHCSKIIIAAGIKEVKYLHKYDRDCEGIKFLENCNIKCTQIKGE